MKILSLIISTTLMLLSLQAYALVDAKELAATDMALELTKESFQTRLSELPEARDYMEGKLQAAYINMVEDDLQSISDELDSINSLEEIDHAFIDRIQNDIREVQELINEMWP